MIFADLPNRRPRFTLERRHYCGGSSSASSSTSASQTNNTDSRNQSDNRQDNRTDNSNSGNSTVDSRNQSDNRVDARQDNRNSGNTTSTVTQTTDSRNQSDNRVDARQDNSSVNNSDNRNQSDNRQDLRQDNRVTTITNNSADVGLIQSAYDNLAKSTAAQANSFAASLAANRAASDAAAAALRQGSSDNLSATRAAISGVLDANGNLAAVSGASISATERVNATSLLALRDTQRDTLAFATGSNRDALGVAGDVFRTSLDAITGQTTKDLKFAGEFLGNVFTSQKNADTQNTQQIVDAAKVLGVVGLLAYAATRLEKKAA